ncbi:MAG: ATP-binding protein [Gammaproteobacteria bacterium]|nr:ATP-binding protein [Gammaproteobacteria bacterium]
MQLQQKIFIVLALMTGIPLLVLLFGVVDKMEQEVRNRTEIELLGGLDKMAEELNLILHSQESIAKGLAKVPAVRRFAASVSGISQGTVSRKTYQKYADELENFFLNYQHAVPSIQALRFIDTNGKSLVKVKEGKPIEPKYSDDQAGRLFIADQSNKRFFREAVNSKLEISMSDFELGQVSMEADFCPAMVRYSVNVRDEVDRLEGFLVVNIWGSRLDATMESSLRGYPGKNYIIEISDDPNRDGIYLYHEETRRRFADQMNSQYRFSKEIGIDRWQEIKTAEKNGSLHLHDGRMLYFQKLSPYKNKSTKWLLVVDADSKALLSEINSMRHSIWVILGLLVLASILVAVWASGRLAQPVHELAEIITAYADGDNKSSYTDIRNDEIGLAGKAFNYLKDKLEHTEKERDKAARLARQSERLASVGQLAAGIGHEINNPLMNIMSLASLIEQEVKGSNPSVSSDIQLLQKEGNRCARIVQGILSFARESKPKLEQFELNALIYETTRLLKHRLESSNVELSIDVEEPLLIFGDANQLQQVLVNILLNSIQASTTEATIKVKAWQKAGSVCIQIIDSGSGIDEESLTHIFDPFFTTKKEGEGTGLGLSVSYGIIKHHGGTINIDNNEHGGVVVSIEIPVDIKKFEEQKEIMEVENVT